MRFFSGNRNSNNSGNKGPASNAFMQKLKGSEKKPANEASFAAIREKCEGAYNKMLAEYDKGRGKTIGGRNVQHREISQTAKNTLAHLAQRKTQNEVKQEQREAAENEKQKKNKARQAQLLDAQSKARESTARDIPDAYTSSSTEKQKSYFFGYTDESTT